MKLQSQDFIAAQEVQKELLRLCPDDPVLKQFSALLPAEAEWQKEMQ